MKYLCATVFGIILALMPIAVWATQFPGIQNPVADHTITANEIPRGTVSDAYVFHVTWPRPDVSGTVFAPSQTSFFGAFGAAGVVPQFPPAYPPAPSPPAADGIAAGAGWMRFPDRYLLQFRNITDNEGWPAMIGTAGSILPHQHGAPWDAGFAPGSTAATLQAPGAQTEVIPAPTLTRTLPHSSLFEMRILPRRYAPVWFPIIGPGGYAVGHGVEWMRVEPSAPPEITTIFLSDIRIHSVEANTSELVVYFHDPGTLDGQPFFTDWNISWRPTSTVAADSIAINEPHMLNRGHARISHAETYPVGGGLRRAVISTVDFQPAASIEVRIEPIRNGVVLREHMGRIPGTNYNFRARPIAYEFRYPTPVVVRPLLTLDMLGQDFFRLQWSSLTGLVPAPTRLNIVEIMPDGSERVIGTLEGGNAQIIRVWTLPAQPRIERTFRVDIFVPGQALPISTNEVVYSPLFAPYSPYAPDVLRAIAVPGATSGYIAPFDFLAFSRRPFTYTERAMADARFAPPANFIDLDLVYRIYITDQFHLLGEFVEGVWIPGVLPDNHNFVAEVHARDLGDVFEGLRPGHTSPRAHFSWPTGQHPLDSYVSADGMLRPLGGNRSYNIMIYAVRVDEDGMPLLDRDGRALISRPAHYRVFMPPFGGIPVHAQVMARPPLRVNLPRLAHNMIPLQWDLRYFEIAEPEVPGGPGGITRDVWHSSVAVAGGSLLFGQRAQFAQDPTRRFTSINQILWDYVADDGTRPGRDILADLIAPTFDPHNHEHAGEMIARATLLVNSWIGDANGGQPVALRIVDLGRYPPAPGTQMRTRFYIHAITRVAMYELLEAAGHDFDTVGGAYELYVEHFLSDPNDPHGRPHTGSPWVLLDLADLDIVDNTVSHDLLQAAGAPILPNEQYIVFMFPERIFPHAPGQWQALHPTYIVVTTPPEGVRPIPDPTVPVLIPVPEFTSHSTVGVRWRLQGGFDPTTGVPTDMRYHLRWSELWTDYPDGGNLIEWEEIESAIRNTANPSGVRMVDGFYYVFFRIDGLFVDTDHYIWARAENLAGGLSQWSNPVVIRTLNIAPPPPPRSLMRATSGVMNVFNAYTNQNPPFGANEPNALNISFLRIFEDLDLGLPRAEAGTSTGGMAVALPMPLPAYNAMHLTRFTGLRANTTHYVRARTILTVRRGPTPGTTVTTYSYEIHVATNPEFLDAIIFIIPADTEFIAPGDANARQAVSEWLTIQTETGRGDDFDGVHRPEQFPLPDRDWEFVYDPLTQTLTYRFRTNQIGADGRPDNQVDQRFISRLIAERTFTFHADLSHYNNLPITNRVVVVPMSIVRAFHERGITFAIDAGDFVLSIPPGSFDTAAVRGIAPGIGTYFHINMSGAADRLPTLTPGLQYATMPMTLGVEVRNRTSTISVPAFARPISVTMPMADHLAPGAMHTASLFAAGAGFAGWQQIPHTFSFVQNAIVGTTQQPVSVAGVISVAAPPPIVAGSPHTPYHVAYQNVARHITFVDLLHFDPHATVNATQMNNVMNALVRSLPRVTLGAQLPANEMTQLQNARMAAAGDLNFEQAVDILLRLYELRTGWMIATPQTVLNQLPGGNATSPQYVRSIRAAADIGMVAGPINPQAPLTMGQLMVMLDVFLVDTR